jgi:hypothetical protein
MDARERLEHSYATSKDAVLPLDDPAIDLAASLGLEPKFSLSESGVLPVRRRGKMARGVGIEPTSFRINNPAPSP